MQSAEQIAHEFVNGHCDFSIVHNVRLFQNCLADHRLISSLCKMFRLFANGNEHLTITQLQCAKQNVRSCVSFKTQVWRHSHNRHIEVLVLKKMFK